MFVSEKILIDVRFYTINTDFELKCPVLTPKPPIPTCIYLPAILGGAPKAICPLGAPWVTLGPVPWRCLEDALKMPWRCLEGALKMHLQGNGGIAQVP